MLGVLQSSRVRSGTLTTADGVPVPGKVLLMPMPGTSPVWWSFAANRSTDERGRFKFGRLGPGEYKVWPKPEVGTAEPRSITVVGDERVRLRIGVDLDNRLLGMIAGLMDGESDRFLLPGVDEAGSSG